jgi:hypothetical protein
MSDGFFVNGFVWLIVIGLELALLVIAGPYSAFIPQYDRTPGSTAIAPS